MTHPLDQLAPYVDGALDPTERVRVDEHLRACARCREEVEAATLARRALASMPAPEPIDLASRFDPQRVRRLRSTPTSGRASWGRWAPALAAAAVVALVALAVPRLGGSSDDAASGDRAESAAGPDAGAFAGSAGPVRLRVDPTDYDEASLQATASAFVGAQAPLEDAAGETGGAGASATTVEAPGALRFAGPRTEAAAACLDEAFPDFPGRLVELRQASFEGTPAYLGFVLEGARDGSPDLLSIWVAAVEDCSILSITSARF